MDIIIIVALFAIQIYTLIIITSVIISWLIAFDILPKNQITYTIVNTVTRLTAPVFDAVRSVIPTWGGLDFSPIVILLALQGMRYGIITTFAY